MDELCFQLGDSAMTYLGESDGENLPDISRRPPRAHAGMCNHILGNMHICTHAAHGDAWEAGEEEKEEGGRGGREAGRRGRRRGCPQPLIQCQTLPISLFALGAGHEVQWQGTRLVCVRPWVSSMGLNKYYILE